MLTESERAPARTRSARVTASRTTKRVLKEPHLDTCIVRAARCVLQQWKTPRTRKATPRSKRFLNRRGGGEIRIAPFLKLEAVPKIDESISEQTPERSGVAEPLRPRRHLAGSLPLVANEDGLSWTPAPRSRFPKRHLKPSSTPRAGRLRIKYTRTETQETWAGAILGIENFIISTRRLN